MCVYVGVYRQIRWLDSSVDRWTSRYRGIISIYLSNYLYMYIYIYTRIGRRWKPVTCIYRIRSGAFVWMGILLSDHTFVGLWGSILPGSPGSRRLQGGRGAA